MTWAEILTYRLGKDQAHYIAEEFDANAEFKIFDVLSLFGFIPSKHSIVVARTTGSTDTVDVDLDVSDDQVGWETIATLTSSSTPVQTTVVDKMGRYVRIIVNTVGSGNDLKLSGSFSK